LTNKIPKMRENLDAVASTAQRATDAANAAGIAITVIEDDRKRAAAAVVSLETDARSHVDSIRSHATQKLSARSLSTLL